MADLAAIAKIGAAAAFQVAGTAKSVAVLHVKGTGSYDAGTDQITTPVTDTTIEGVLYSPKQIQGAQAVGFDAVFVFEGVDAPGGVDEASTITIEGMTWNIAQVLPVPTKAIIQLGLRR